MKDLNQLIISKLDKYPPDVAELAKEALKAAETMAPSTVVDFLEPLVRKIIKEKDPQ